MQLLHLHKQNNFFWEPVFELNLLRSTPFISFWLSAMNERQRHILEAAVTWQLVLPLSSALGESLDSPRWADKSGEEF